MRDFDEKQGIMESEDKKEVVQEVKRDLQHGTDFMLRLYQDLKNVDYELIELKKDIARINEVVDDLSEEELQDVGVVVIDKFDNMLGGLWDEISGGAGGEEDDIDDIRALTDEVIGDLAEISNKLGRSTWF